MMKQATTYRQMELNPRMADGEMHSPEQVWQQMEQARQRIAEIETALATKRQAFLARLPLRLRCACRLLP